MVVLANKCNTYARCMYSDSILVDKDILVSRCLLVPEASTKSNVMTKPEQDFADYWLSGLLKKEEKDW